MLLRICGRATCTAALLFVSIGCASGANGIQGELPAASRTVSYTCANNLDLRVRFDATNARITVNGDGPFTLPQTTGRADFTVYSDGAYSVQMAQGSLSFAMGRGALRACLRS